MTDAAKVPIGLMADMVGYTAQQRDRMYDLQKALAYAGATLEEEDSILQSNLKYGDSLQALITDQQGFKLVRIAVRLQAAFAYQQFVEWQAWREKVQWSEEGLRYDPQYNAIKKEDEQRQRLVALRIAIGHGTIDRHTDLRIDTREGTLFWHADKGLKVLKTLYPTGFAMGYPSTYGLDYEDHVQIHAEPMLKVKPLPNHIHPISVGVDSMTQARLLTERMASYQLSYMLQDLNMQEWSLMHLLWSKNPTQMEMAAELKMNQSSISRMLKKLPLHAIDMHCAWWAAHYEHYYR